MSSPKTRLHGRFYTNINGRSEQVVLKEYGKSDTSLHLFTLL